MLGKVTRLHTDFYSCIQCTGCLRLLALSVVSWGSSICSFQSNQVTARVLSTNRHHATLIYPLFFLSAVSFVLQLWPHFTSPRSMIQLQDLLNELFRKSCSRSNPSQSKNGDQVQGEISFPQCNCRGI